MQNTQTLLVRFISHFFFPSACCSISAVLLWVTTAMAGAVCGLLLPVVVKSSDHFTLRWASLSFYFFFLCCLLYRTDREGEREGERKREINGCRGGKKCSDKGNEWRRERRRKTLHSGQTKRNRTAREEEVQTFNTGPQQSVNSVDQTRLFSSFLFIPIRTITPQSLTLPSSDPLRFLFAQDKRALCPNSDNLLSKLMQIL